MDAVFVTAVLGLLALNVTFNAACYFRLGRLVGTVEQHDERLQRLERKISDGMAA